MARTKSIQCRSEKEIACELVCLLDGLSIEAAKNALLRATQVLTSSQVVSSKSLLLRQSVKSIKD
jgi:hypothetical protein